ncbi:MAG: class I SAM-dependent methyltransferase, partial [Candidatus Micrarchaeota archaeon]|nr:class I SAM-dependent methyltransferase [Candidatus Micrarchaeota archaeon]
KVYVGNFVTKPLNRKFHGVMLISSFHLFPAEDVPRVLRRIRSLLLPGGYCLISIGENFLPKGKDKDEGYFPKSSAPDKIRFMTRYTRKAFKDVFKDLDWAKVSDFYVRHDRDVLGETWMNIVIRKTA